LGPVPQPWQVCIRDVTYDGRATRGKIELG
jgi:hypothetical protein